MKRLYLATAAAMAIATATMADTPKFPGAETVGFAQDCFVPIISKKDPAKVLYWNIAVSCTSDRARTVGAAEKQEAIEREEARMAALSQ